MKILQLMSNLKFRDAKAKTLLFLFVVTVVMVVVNLALVSINSARDQVYIQTASDLRVVSQEIVRNAAQAVAGSDEAFARLAESRNAFETSWSMINEGRIRSIDSGLGFLTSLPPRRSYISMYQPGIEPVWQQVRDNADLILENRERIASLNAITATVAQNIPQLQREYDQVVNILLDNDAAVTTIAVAQRQAWLSERIALNLNRILAGNADAAAALEQFQRDISLFASNHDALLQGDSAIGVSRVGNAEARSSLQSVSTLFSEIESHTAGIVAAAPEILRASAALDAITTDSARLLAEMTSLSRYFNNARGDHLASPSLGYGLLLVILLLIALYGMEVIRQSKLAEQMSAELNRKNNKAVMSLLEEISDLADGDLTVEATVSEEFTGAIADSINYAVGQLRGLVTAISEVIVQVTDSTRSSETTAQHLSEASQRQTQSIGSVYDSVREMEDSINRVSDNASRSLDVAKSSVEIAAGGAEVVKDTIRGMNSIRGQIQETAKRIKRLGENSQEIGSFVSLINDIADHTNTLSLNAAIQAAMAGDAGKGFGVVADQVHALAERSTDATRQIESLVKVIQRDINEAVASMEQTTSQVVQGANLAQGAGEALDDIENVSRELAALVEEITQAARNQSRTAAEISHSMATIQTITAETSAGTRATGDFIANLGNLTQRLDTAVAGFRLPQEPEQAQGRQAVPAKVQPGQDAQPVRLDTARKPAEQGSGRNYNVRRAVSA